MAQFKITTRDLKTGEIIRISPRLVSAFERFNADLDAFRNETGDDLATLYEDAYTTRYVKDFSLKANGTLTWIEDGAKEKERLLDDDEARDYLSYWRANLRRAKRYWAMDTETLDRIQDPEDALEDNEN